MDIGVELIVGGIVAIVTGLAGVRMLGRRKIIDDYMQGRALRLRGEYAEADAKLAVASVGFPSAQVLRFWLMVECNRIADAKALLNDIPKSLAGQECVAWMTIRFDTLPNAEREIGNLLHLMGMNSSMPPWLHASALYTHACLLVEEGSVNYALERLSNSIQIARTAYGYESIYAVPQAVALSFLHFQIGNYDKSAKLLANSLRSYSRELGAEHPRTARVRTMLAIVAATVGFGKEAQIEVASAAGTFHKFGLDELSTFVKASLSKINAVGATVTSPEKG